MAEAAGLTFKRPSVIPGFGLALGFALTYLGLIVLIPLAAMVLKAATLGFAGFWEIVTNPRTMAALHLSFLTSLVAAIINAIFGGIIAWVLVRYRFPGRRLLDAFVDLPFALPTAVAGIALTAIYAPNGWIGSLLAPLGVKVAYTPLGILIALIFIGLPFVVRTVQPVLEEFDREVEEAAATLGARRRQTVFSVMLPALVPAVLTGFALALARAVGEYGSVIFIAGNIPYVSEIAPLLIIIRLEEFGYAEATAIGTAMLLISFGLLLFVHLVQAWRRRRFGND
ncbi:MAG: sulfate ABC transporter permease subunit CysT [Methyloceanibacter sp.]